MNNARKDEQSRAQAPVEAKTRANEEERDLEAKGDYGQPRHDRRELVEEGEGGRELQPPSGAIRSGEPDVLLEVPELDVEEITLNVSELRARVALHAAVGNLVALDVGADVSVERVDLNIKGVHAEALLKVHLDRVYDVLARTLTTIDRNPQLLDHILEPVGEAVGTVSRTVEKTVPEIGKAVSTTVEEAVPELGRAVGTTVGATVPRVAESAGDVVGRTVPEVAAPAREVVEKTVHGAAPDAEAGRDAVVKETTRAPAGPARTVVERTEPDAAVRTVEERGPKVAAPAQDVVGETPATDTTVKEIAKKTPLGPRVRSAVASSARRFAAASARLGRRAVSRGRKARRER